MMKNQGCDLFIVDNSDREWKFRNYLEQWADLSVSFDIKGDSGHQFDAGLPFIRHSSDIV